MEPDESSIDWVTSLHEHWAWIADWKDHDEALPGRRVSFRHEWTRQDTTNTVLIRLTADTRYKLLVNGERIAVGPSRGSDRVWYYDTIDIAPYLKPGPNTLRIDVLRCFPQKDMAWTFGRTRRPGLTIVGQDGEHSLSMGSSWRVANMPEIRYPSHDLDLFLHIFEEGLITDCHEEWMEPQMLSSDALFASGYGLQQPWNLAPRMIPLAEETELRPASVRDAESTLDQSRWTAWLLHDEVIELPAMSRHRLEIEFDSHSTAFWRMLLNAGTGDHTIKLTYSEAYEELPRRRPDNPHLVPLKGVRSHRGEGIGLDGPCDTYRLRYARVSGTQVTLEPFWWRTFRYIVLELHVGDQPLVLDSFIARQTNYPIDATLSVDLDGSVEVRKMVQVSERTMRNCMFDGYSDCPFYEQLQYGEDARSSMLFHYNLSGDDRLARQAITAFAASAQSDGILHGRYPAQGAQIITIFSLFWVLQVCDHHQYFGDDQFSRSFTSLLDGVLAFFDRHIGPYGLVEGLPQKYWNFIDWHPDWVAPEDISAAGTPLSGRMERRWTYISLLYSFTLQQAARLMEGIGRSQMGQDYSSRARYYTDTIVTQHRTYSQHCQVMAVLCGASTEKSERRRITLDSIRQQTSGHRFTRCSLILQHFVFRALAKVGSYEAEFNGMWEPWRDMLALDLTTWAEGDVDNRSDCHAWSSLPLYEFPAEVAGLKPRGPGFATVSFQPRIRCYRRAAFTVPMGKRGLAKVSWERTDHDLVRVRLGLSFPSTVYVRVDDSVEEERKEVGPESELIFDVTPELLKIDTACASQGGLQISCEDDGI